MNQNEADYTYEVKDFNGQAAIIIEDQSMGNISVTDDIENVVKDITDRILVDSDDCIIICKDGSGFYDGWDSKSRSFLSLNTLTESQALEKYVEVTKAS